MPKEVFRTTTAFHTAVDIEMAPGTVVDGFQGPAAVEGAVDRGRGAVWPCLTSKASTTTWTKDGSGEKVDG